MRPLFPLPALPCLLLLLAGMYGTIGTAQTALLTPFETQALAAFSPGSASHSLQLSGTVHRLAGSTDEKGTVTFQVADTGQQQEQWQLDSGAKTLTRTAFADGGVCSLVLGTKSSSVADSSCARPVSWFLPSVSLWQLSEGTAVAQDATTQADIAAGLTRLRFGPPVQTATGKQAKLQGEFTAFSAAASTDVLIGTVTGLPARVEYTIPVQNDPAFAVAYAVAFSDYRVEAGLMIPHHIQRYIQRTLESDIQITAVEPR